MAAPAGGEAAAEAFDLVRLPVYLMAGEYDYSCTPASTEETARRIPGARAIVMRGLGHFPMSENPARFRGYLLPVLEEIRSRLHEP